MRQRLILAAVALIASLATGELVLNLQRQPATTAQVAVASATATPASAAVASTATPEPTAGATVAQTPAATPVAWILTARQAITQGTLLRPSTVDALFVRTPLTTPAPPGSVSSPDDLRILLRPDGRIAATSLLGGDPLLLSDIGYGQGTGHSVAGEVPAGYVGVTLQVAGVAGLQGIVTPGDDVDVVSAAVSGQALPPGGNPLAGVRVRYLATARVIALGPLENEITVAVPRAVAPALVAASELQSHLHLILRPWSGALPTITATPVAPGIPPTPAVGRSGA